MDLSNDVIFGILGSEDLFPVDFNQAWCWIGYSTKGNAKIALESSGFIEGLDFRFFMNSHKKSNRGRPSEKIMLSIDCFKSFAMMAGTERGKQVRQYFLECEKELRRRLQEERDHQKQRVLRAVVNESPSTWQRRYEDEFFEEAYRVTGWKRPLSGHYPCMGGFINKSIYGYFPEGTPERLRQVNPVNLSGNRSRKHHQYLSERLGIPLLSNQQAVAMAVMRLSPSANPRRFKENLQKACGNSFQIELPLEDENP